MKSGFRSSEFALKVYGMSWVGVLAFTGTATVDAVLAIAGLAGLYAQQRFRLKKG